MAKQMNKDPWELDISAQSEIQSEIRGRRQRTLCPKVNKDIGGRCFVCEKVQSLFDSGEQDKIDMAKRLSAKPTIYVNAVLPSNPSKVVIIELGIKAANAILDGINLQEWGNITHPKKGKGREIKITKKRGNGGFNEYPTNPALNPADYDVPDETLNSRYNLSNMLELLKTEDILNVATLKMDETLTFRILPAWDDGKGNKKIMKPMWYHWGVTEAEVNGETAILEYKEEDTQTLWDTAKEEEKVEKVEQTADTAPSADEEHEACFGNEACFDENDEECKNCKDFKACARIVAKKAAEKSGA